VDSVSLVVVDDVQRLGFVSETVLICVLLILVPMPMTMKKMMMLSMLLMLLLLLMELTGYRYSIHLDVAVPRP